MMVPVGRLDGRDGAEGKLTLEGITRDLLPYYLSISTYQEGGKMPLLTSSPLIQCETQNTLLVENEIASLTKVHITGES